MYLFLLQLANAGQQGWNAINWNVILPTVIAAIGVMFTGWIALQNNRITKQNDNIHTAVNSTATRLADEAKEQGELIKNLMVQVASLTEEAKGKDKARLVERVQEAESKTTPRRGKP
jgi:hypothetical protein